jgi:hypothetical protein
LLLFKCLGEIAPTIPTGKLPEATQGYFNLFDQALDLGILVPFSIIVGILLLKRNIYGYLLSTASLILFINLGLSVTLGQIVLGITSGNLPIQIPGIAIFSIFMVFDTAILRLVIKNIENKIV